MKPHPTVSSTIHKGYVCSKCAAHHVKLWRPYQPFGDHIELTCQACSEADKGTTLELEHSDSIGGLVPAVPTETDTFWGYTSVPQNLVEWWKTLPAKEEEPQCQT